MQGGVPHLRGRDLLQDVRGRAVRPQGWVLLRLPAGLPGESRDSRLREPARGDYDFIVVPGVSAVRQSTVAGLEAYMKRGTKVILYGDKCLAKDRYWRNHPNSAVVEGADRIARQKNRRRLAAELNGVLTRGGLSRIALTDARTGAPAWGVDYRVVPRHDAPTLVSALNVLKEPVQVALDLPGRAVDLVTGAQVDLKRIQLDPMEFVLLEIQEDPAPTPAASP